MKHFVIVGAKSVGLDRFADNVCKDQDIRFLKYVFDRSDYDNMKKLDECGLLPKIGQNLDGYLEKLVGDECERTGLVLSYEELADWQDIWACLAYANIEIFHWKQEDYLQFYVSERIQNEPILIDTQDLMDRWLYMQGMWEEMDQRIGFCHQVWDEDLETQGYRNVFDILQLDFKTIQYSKIDVKASILNWKEVEQVIKSEEVM